MDHTTRYLAKRHEGIGEPLDLWIAAALAMTGIVPPFPVMSTGAETDPSSREGLPPSPPNPAQFLAEKIEPLWRWMPKEWETFRSLESSRSPRTLKLIVLIEALPWALRGRPLRRHLRSALKFYECSADGTSILRDFRGYVGAIHHTLSFASSLVRRTRARARTSLRRLRFEPTGTVSFDAPLNPAEPLGATVADRLADDASADAFAEIEHRIDIEQALLMLERQQRHELAREYVRRRSAGEDVTMTDVARADDKTEGAGRQQLVKVRAFFRKLGLIH